MLERVFVIDESKSQYIVHHYVKVAQTKYTR